MAMRVSVNEDAARLRWLEANVDSISLGSSRAGGYVVNVCVGPYDNPSEVEYEGATLRQAIDLARAAE